jgi:hypothetical protein
VTGIRLPEIYIDNANFGGKAGKIKRNNPAKGFGPKGNEDVKFRPKLCCYAVID